MNEPRRVYGCDPATGPDDHETLVEALLHHDGTMEITAAVTIDPEGAPT